MRKIILAKARIAFLCCCVSLLLSARAASAASNGNVDSAHARFITGDGAAYLDNITNLNPRTWFTVPIYHDHSYEISLWAPNNNIQQGDPNISMVLKEIDGTTDVSSTDLGDSEPRAYDPTTGIGGDRVSLVNVGFSVSRQIRIQVLKPSGPLGGTVSFYVRVVDTTLAAARWTVNGYQAFFAINNLSTNAFASGFILYYGQDGTFLSADSYSVGPNGSVQIVKPNGVPINGQLVGGVRLISAANAGQIKAQEYNYNAAGGQYLTFDFGPIFNGGAGLQF